MSLLLDGNRWRWQFTLTEKLGRKRLFDSRLVGNSYLGITSGLPVTRESSTSEPMVR